MGMSTDNRPIDSGLGSRLSGLFDRRDLLRVGSISIAASALPCLANATAAAETSGIKARAKSVLFLWMAGGVTHIDSFDPKPTAPIEVRGVLNDIATSVPGIRFCETVP